MALENGWNSIQEEGTECLKALKCGKASLIPGTDEQSGMAGPQDAFMGKETRIPREAGPREQRA